MEQRTEPPEPGTARHVSGDMQKERNAAKGSRASSTVGAQRNTVRTHVVVVMERLAPPGGATAVEGDDDEAELSEGLLVPAACSEPSGTDRAWRVA